MLLKINMHEFNNYLSQLTQGDFYAQRKAVSGLVRYTGAEWEGTPDAVTDVVGALIRANPRRPAENADGPLQAEIVKVLGNIGSRSPAVVPQLLRILQEDGDSKVRTEAARALGKMGDAAGSASSALAAVLIRQDGGDQLRGEAARALARVDPSSPSTTTALRSATGDRSGHVGVCAAEALWKVSGEVSRAVPVIAAWLSDPGTRTVAAQALYRIGPKAKGAVPALLAVAKDKDRLFRETVVMALTKIDPEAATRARVR